MQFKINRIETYGMKNLSKKICVDFQNQTSNNLKNKDVSNIKAIYGSNGAGKSAFIHSVELYKNLVSKKNYLYQDSIQKELQDLVNDKIKKFFFNVVFTFNDSYENKELTKILKHEITIKFDGDRYNISKEELSILSDQTINGNYKKIYSNINGVLDFSDKYNDKATEFIINKTNNLLKQSSVNSYFDDYDFIYSLKKILDALNKEEIKSSKIIMMPYLLASNINTYLDEDDMYVSCKTDLLERIVDNLKIEREYYRNKISSGEDLISKEDIKNYESKIKRLCKFVQVFKHDLLDIKIEKIEDKHLYHCRKKLVYKDYKVDSSNESTGIKKLMRIFNSIEAVTNGCISFIDELDSNINPIYLNKLLEYLQKTNKGQLCFTSHNMYPMHFLYSFSHSIDFLGETGKLVSWKKNGNYKPYNKYPEGMIDDSPFNVDYFDFIKVFESEGE